MKLNKREQRLWHLASGFILHKNPGNWPGFLQSNENKQDLFRFLAQKCVDYETEGDKTIYSTVDDQVVCSSRGTITSAFAPCSHEEADSRIFVYVKDMAQQGHMKVMIRTVDADVVVIAVAKFLQIGLEELWVAFGNGKNYRHIEVHQTVAALGQRSHRHWHFHAFTGCDMVSFFSNCGKKSAWRVWQAYP